MSGLRILASGLSGGIGLAFSQSAATHSDWRLAGLARHPVPGEYPFDATWPEDRIRATLKDLGPIDALICLHGADIGSPPLRQTSYLTRLQSLYAIDIEGTIKLVRAALPILNPGGAIVLMGSDEAAEGSPGETGELYAIAKAAVTSYGKSLAETMGRRARVAVVAPGWVLTRWAATLSAERRERVVRRARSGHWQTPEQVARVIERLLTSQDWPSGLVTYVDQR